MNGSSSDAARGPSLTLNGLSAQVTHCQSRHPLQRRRSVSIDLGTESMPELEPGTNAVLQLCGRPGRLFCGQHLRELVRGIAEQGSDYHRDNEQDQRVGERGRDQVLQWAG